MSKFSNIAELTKALTKASESDKKHLSDVIDEAKEVFAKEGKKVAVFRYLEDVGFARGDIVRISSFVLGADVVPQQVYGQLKTPRPKQDQVQVELDKARARIAELEEQLRVAKAKPRTVKARTPRKAPAAKKEEASA